MLRAFCALFMDTLVKIQGEEEGLKKVRQYRATGGDQCILPTFRPIGPLVGWWSVDVLYSFGVGSRHISPQRLTWSLQIQIADIK